MGIIAKQSFYNLLFNGSSLIMSFLNAFILVPFLLKDNLDKWGLVNILVIYATFFSDFVGFGLLNSWIKFFFKFDSKQNNSFIAFILFFVSIISLVLFFVIYFFKTYIIDIFNINDPLVVEYFTFIAPLGTAILLFNIFFYYSISSFKVVFPFLISTNYHRALYILMILLYYFEVLDLYGFILILFLGYFVRLIILIFYIHFTVKKIKLSLNFSILPIKKIFKYSFFAFLASFCTNFVISIDRIFVSIYFGLENLAIYSFAVYATSQIIVFYNSMHNSVLPLISKSIAENNIKKLEFLYKKTSIISLVLGGIYFVVLVSNIDDIFRILPDKFYPSLNILLLFILTALIKLTESISEHIVYNSKFYRFATFSYLFLALLSLFLTFTSSYFFNSMIYIAISISILYILKSFVYVVYVFRKMSITPFTKSHLLTMLFVIAISFFARGIIIVDNPIINIIIKTPFLIGIYFLFIIKTKFFPDLKSFYYKLFLKK